MQRPGHLRRALVHRGFRRLYLVRLAGQFGDGVFQASLAGAVLFDPNRQAHAADIAAGFAILLLPYSLVGPFAGVLLDRWWRQRVLVNANLVRAVGVVGVGSEIAAGVHGQPFYASALVVISVNRFVLSGLSTALPHVVQAEELVTANAVSTTSGGLATTAGGGVALALRFALGSGNTGYAALAIAACVPYGLSALIARGFGQEALGPDDVERASRERARDVAAGLVDGARHVWDTKSALYALSMIGLHRFCYGITTLTLLLLYRNYFTGEGVLRAGIGGLAQVLALVAVGNALAAVVTPFAARHLGFVRWPVVLLFVAAATQLGLMLTFSMPLMLVAAFCLGVAAQGIKICVDTIVQRSVSDQYRGRIFSLYDTLFNVTFVGSAVATAALLPESGHSPTAVAVLGGIYVLDAVGYLALTSRQRDPVATFAPEPRPVQGAMP